MSTEALQWFKSTYSGSEGGQCLEVATTLQVTPSAWAAFVATA
ncbi:DUF397 domain-containing protein [Streptomyces sp. NPDC057280]